MKFSRFYYRVCLIVYFEMVLELSLYPAVTTTGDMDGKVNIHALTFLYNTFTFVRNGSLVRCCILFVMTENIQHVGILEVWKKCQIMISEIITNPYPFFPPYVQVIYLVLR